MRTNSGKRTFGNHSHIYIKHSKPVIFVCKIHYNANYNDDMVLHHTLPIFTGLGQCPIVNWDFVGAVSIFGPDALSVVHQ